MKLSIVDVSTIPPGKTRHETLQDSIELAKHAERWGYERFWVAEHHSASFAAGRVPEVLIAAIAAQTHSIKVGSGSVLLNHYSAFKVAEVFSTLSELYPNRIDLGAGRATAGPIADLALQQDRSRQFRANSDQQIAELVAWLDDSFAEDHPFSQIPIYTDDIKPNLFLLGSSSWSAGAAASLGLRYVFAGFINQNQAKQIIHSYRQNFRPAEGRSGVQKPEVILSVHAVCADTEEEARKQLAPVHIMYRNLAQGNIHTMIPNPQDAVKELGGLPTLEKYVAGSGVPPRFIGGTPESVQRQFEDLAKDFSVKEIMIQDMITDPKARLHSYELMSEMIEQD